MAKVRFTASRIAGFRCPPDKAQAFLWDLDQPGLALRTTPAGKPAYVFQGVFIGKTIRVTIGSPAAWSIAQAQEKAREIQRHIDEGRDPREVKAATSAAAQAEREARLGATATVGEAWAAYIAERTPQWGELHRLDHARKASPGGKKATRGTRGTGETRPGPLYALMSLPLRDLDSATIEAWAVREAATRPSSARLAWRLLKVFLGWCTEHPAYSNLLPDKNPAKTAKTREALGRAGTRSDVLQKGQLKSWFQEVRKIQNPAIAAALQVVLLTGARPGEVLKLQWADVDAQWKGLTMRDKVDGQRVIPLTPYVAHLLANLPRANIWVFASAKWAPMDANHGGWVNTSASGHISEPNTPHAKACAAAGLDGLTLNGLRRSFASLTEWLEIPSGVVAQIQGHKPSATAEKHYKRRPLDLLRLHHERIEAWILEQGGITYDASALTPSPTTELIT